MVGRSINPVAAAASFIWPFELVAVIEGFRILRGRAIGGAAPEKRAATHGRSMTKQL
jgi:hypothetical protein